MWVFQVGLDEDNSKLCTFNTSYGKYRFMRLPFGVNTSGDIFNRIMTQIFQGIEGIEVVVDDIMVHGSTKSEHDERVGRILERCHGSWTQLNP